MSDVDVIKQITEKIIPVAEFSTRHRIGHGCGKLRRKCHAWAADLSRGGCTHIVVLHDLDNEDERALRSRLEAELADVHAANSIVLIPIGEIEAWLLTDARAIQAVFRLQRPPRLPGQPESIRDPKRLLEEIVWRTARKRYVNSVHNVHVARESSLVALGTGR